MYFAASRAFGRTRDLCQFASAPMRAKTLLRSSSVLVGGLFVSQREFCMVLYAQHSCQCTGALVLDNILGG